MASMSVKQILKEYEQELSDVITTWHKEELNSHYSLVWWLDGAKRALIIATNKPGAIIGRQGQTINKLRQQLQEKYELTVIIEELPSHSHFIIP